MEQLFKQCVGIDIAKHKFTVCVCKYYLSGKQDMSSVEEFENTKTGFNQFVRWSRKHFSLAMPAVYLMEATGIYYESLAYHLHNLNQQVIVVLPNKVKHYAQSLYVKTKNDITDARVPATMGCHQEFKHYWNPPRPLYRQLRALTRFHSDLQKQRTVFANHLEALNCSGEPLPSLINAYRKLVDEMDISIHNTLSEIEKLIHSDDELCSRIRRLETIKGVGFLTIAIIIAETQGFDLISSRKQLASYAGLDIVERQSGQSVCGKTKISKKGNSHIRAALYFPAMVASRYNAALREDYRRIIARNPKHKKIGITALQRKLLLLIFTLWNNGDTFRDNK
jgi:transposase